MVLVGGAAPAEQEPPEQPEVPAEAITTFRRLTGVDLGFVPINRGPEVAATAAALGARAYTHAGVVHVPAEAGPLDRPDVAALVGHELAHVAQQRLWGPAAAESSEFGAAFEAQAVATERAIRGGATRVHFPAERHLGPAHPARPHLGSAHPAAEPALEAQRAPLLPDSGASWSPPQELLDALASAGQRPPEDAPPQVSTAPESVHTETELVQPPAEQPTPDEDSRPGQGWDDELLGTLSLRVAQQLQGRFVALNRPDDLDTLAIRLYDRLRARLRTELLVDRERSGLLTDFR